MVAKVMTELSRLFEKMVIDSVHTAFYSDYFQLCCRRPSRLLAHLLALKPVSPSITRC